MSTEARDKAIELKSWEVTDAAWSAFDAEEYMTNGIQAAYDVGLRDARGQVTPDEEAIKKVVLDAIYAERIEEGHPAKNTIRYELAEAITHSVLALFNEKGNE